MKNALAHPSRAFYRKDNDTLQYVTPIVLLGPKGQRHQFYAVVLSSAKVPEHHHLLSAQNRIEGLYEPDAPDCRRHQWRR